MPQRKMEGSCGQGDGDNHQDQNQRDNKRKKPFDTPSASDNGNASKAKLNKMRDSERRFSISYPSTASHRQPMAPSELRLQPEQDLGPQRHQINQDNLNMILATNHEIIKMNAIIVGSGLHQEDDPSSHGRVNRDQNIDSGAFPDPSNPLQETRHLIVERKEPTRPLPTSSPGLQRPPGIQRSLSDKLSSSGSTTSAFQPYPQRSDLQPQMPPQETPERSAPIPIPRDIPDNSNPTVASEPEQLWAQQDQKEPLDLSLSLGSLNHLRDSLGRGEHNQQQQEPSQSQADHLAAGEAPASTSNPNREKLKQQLLANVKETIDNIPHPTQMTIQQNRIPLNLFEQNLSEAAPSSSMNPTQQLDPHLEQHDQQTDRQQEVTDEEIVHFFDLLKKHHEEKKFYKK
jgi:hypothetical protein